MIKRSWQNDPKAVQYWIKNIKKIKNIQITLLKKLTKKFGYLKYFSYI